jgi:ABC-type glycerol-3-phosphate transport system permease component
MSDTAPTTSGSAWVVFVFLGGWNDLLAPPIYLDSNEKLTVAIGMANMVTRADPKLNLLTAANLIMMVPAVLLLLLRSGDAHRRHRFRGSEGMTVGGRR